MPEPAPTAEKPAITVALKPAPPKKVETTENETEQEGAAVAAAPTEERGAAAESDERTSPSSTPDVGGEKAEAERDGTAEPEKAALTEEKGETPAVLVLAEARKAIEETIEALDSGDQDDRKDPGPTGPDPLGEPDVESSAGEAVEGGGARNLEDPAHAATGKIIVCLGSTPEFGDPHYRISVDGRQMASGNVDWSLGIPAVSDEEGGICWQEVTIPWDFAAGSPKTLAVSYESDHASRDAGLGSLLVDWVEVDGRRFAGNGPAVVAKGGFIPWPGDAAQRSWLGDLVFDFAAAGDTAEETASEKPRAGPDGGSERVAVAGEEGSPLVIHISESDLGNPSVLSELAGFRVFLRGEDDTRIDPARRATFINLGLNSGRWNDVMVIAPDGSPVSLDGDFGVPDEPKPDSPSLEEAAPEETEPGAEELQAAEAPSEAEIPAFSASAEVVPEPQTAPEPEARGEEAEPRFDETYRMGLEIRRDFVLKGLRKGLARAEGRLLEHRTAPSHSLVRKPSESDDVATDETAAADDTEGAALQPLGDGDARIKDYYGHVLQRALDKLQETIGEIEADPLEGIGIAATPPLIAISRSSAEQIRIDFLNDNLQRALAREGSGNDLNA